MTHKTIIEIEGVEDKDTRYSVKAKGKGYFSVFKKEYDSDTPTPNLEEIRVGNRVEVLYTEKPNPNNKEYPFKTIREIIPFDQNSEFAFEQGPQPLVKTADNEKIKEVLNDHETRLRAVENFLLEKDGN